MNQSVPWKRGEANRLGRLLEGEVAEFLRICAAAEAAEAGRDRAAAAGRPRSPILSRERVREGQRGERKKGSCECEPDGSGSTSGLNPTHWELAPPVSLTWLEAIYF